MVFLPTKHDHVCGSFGPWFWAKPIYIYYHIPGSFEVLSFFSPITAGHGAAGCWIPWWTRHSEGLGPRHPVVRTCGGLHRGGHVPELLDVLTGRRNKKTSWPDFMGASETGCEGIISKNHRITTTYMGQNVHTSPKLVYSKLSKQPGKKETSQNCL